MTFPLDPGARAFQAEAAQQAASARTPVLPPPEAFQAEDGEHEVVTRPEPADAGAPQPS